MAALLKFENFIFYQNYKAMESRAIKAGINM